MADHFAHWPQVEDPDAVVAIYSTFLNRAFDQLMPGLGPPPM